MVFLTIVTYNRNSILLEQINIIKDSLKYTKTKIKFNITAIVILKDHLHVILQPDNIEDYPSIVKYFKTYFSRQIDIQNVDLPEGKKHKKEKGIWQSRYWAHVILNENDLNKHIDYIHYNPMKHYNIAPKNWKYSSFMKYVNNNLYDINWCNYNDKNKIAELDFE